MMNMDIAELHSTYETVALASAMSTVLVAHSAHHPVLAQRTPCTCAVLHLRTGREPASTKIINYSMCCSAPPLQVPASHSTY